MIHDLRDDIMIRRDPKARAVCSQRRARSDGRGPGADLQFFATSQKELFDYFVNVSSRPIASLWALCAETCFYLHIV